MMRYIKNQIKDVIPNGEQQENFSNIFTLNNILPFEFAHDLHMLLLKSEPKQNALRMWGVANSCKTLIANCISKYFVTCYMNNHGSENEFFLSNMLNKALIHCEELFLTHATAEDFKSILGGQPIDISKKFNEKQTLLRTPVVVTSNHELFGRGYLPPVDEKALLLRCFNYQFIVPYKPTCMLEASQFWLYIFKNLPNGGHFPE